MRFLSNSEQTSQGSFLKISRAWTSVYPLDSCPACGSLHLKERIPSEAVALCSGSSKPIKQGIVCVVSHWRVTQMLGGCRNSESEDGVGAR